MFVVEEDRILMNSMQTRPCLEEEGQAEEVVCMDCLSLCCNITALNIPQANIFHQTQAWNLPIKGNMKIGDFECSKKSFVFIKYSGIILYICWGIQLCISE